MRGRFDTTDTAGDFSHLRDHRRAEGKLYPLPQILMFCLLAMLAGASSYRKMHEFIMAHFRRLRVLFPSKMLKAPCYAQIRNIMAGLDRHGAGVPPACGGIVRLRSGWLDATRGRRQVSAGQL